ncbi:MAG: FGGY family carbohydrate kinase [Opitutales bacterium]
MNKKIIAYDLGTGGLKASLFSKEGALLAFEFEAYKTYNLAAHLQEQCPKDWWQCIIVATKKLIEKTGEDVNNIEALAISGHSLGVVALGEDGELLLDRTPIWSDKRAKKEADEFFEGTDYEKWYMSTGNGFPAECYSIFKILWYKNNMPEIYEKVKYFLGTKDYCNYLFTGRCVTDYSYASGSGVYSLKNRDYDEEYIKHSGIDKSVLPEIIEAYDIVGTLTKEASEATGLPMSVKVACGGVDNSCMALGAGGFKDGHIYTSLGSSAWIALSSYKPVLDFKTKPYVFAHVAKDMYASATCIFSAGTSLNWVLNNFFSSFEDKFKELEEGASASVAGANGVFFNPSLAGGSMLEESSNICGAFAGLNLSHNKNDILRATLEGISLNLRVALDELKKAETNVESMLMVGGGAKSKLWLQLFADIYGLKCIKTSIDQECASLGAAALAAVGVGMWDNFDRIENQHIAEIEYSPRETEKAFYDKHLEKFRVLAHYMSKFGDILSKE